MPFIKMVLSAVNAKPLPWIVTTVPTAPVEGLSGAAGVLVGCGAGAGAGVGVGTTGVGDEAITTGASVVATGRL